MALIATICTSVARLGGIVMNGVRPLIRRRPMPSHDLPADLPDILKRVYAARGVTKPEELERGLAALPHYHNLGGMGKGLDLLQQALREQWSIFIVGDYDADGATSTALVMEALRGCGAHRLSYLVPNRFTQGYGLSPALVEAAKKQGAQLLITVDNGVAAHVGVSAAKAAGMAVIVTDHHLPGNTLPPADALINPNLPGDLFPGKSLAGVGVAFYLMTALRARLRDTGWFRERALAELNLAELLDLVAVGTVADVVPLDAYNRILVEQGLRRIRAGRARPGIRALLKVSGRDPARLTASDLGFAVGPRLNAAGRLDDMAVGIECLLSKDEDAALVLAQRLDTLNRERRALEQEMREQAMATVEQAFSQLDGLSLPEVLCLHDARWHEGVVGLVAGRLKDRFHRPAVVFACAEDGSLKGSARSIPGVHIRDVLADIAARRPGMLKHFGGHAMAAGLSLEPAHLETFPEELICSLRRLTDPEVLQPVVWTDGELGPDEINLAHAEALRAGGPWGQGFPEPLFDGFFTIQQAREVGRGHLKLRLGDPRTGALHDAIAFNYNELGVRPDLEKARFVYRLEVNDWRGERTHQLSIQASGLEIQAG